MDCLPIERISHPADLDATERAHLGSCPRCAALCDELQAFTAGSARVAAAELADAERRLGAFVEHEMEAGTALSAARAGEGGGSPRGFRALARAWNVPLARVAAALATVAVVTGLFLASQRPAPVAPVVRGSPVAQGFSVVSRLDAAAGTVTLGGPRRADADGYVVEILSPELEKLASFGPLTEPGHVLRRGAVPGRAAGTEVYCRVLALRAGATVGESEMKSITLP